MLWFKSSAASRENVGAGDVVARAGAQPYLGPGQWSGDMMMDGVPDVRACVGVRPLILFGASTQQRVAAGDLRERAAGISGVMGRARAQRI